MTKLTNYVYNGPRTYPGLHAEVLQSWTGTCREANGGGSCLYALGM